MFKLGMNYKDKILKIRPEALVGYWPLNERAGTVISDWSIQGNHGSIASVTPADAHGPDHRHKCPKFDGSASYADIYSAALASDFSTTEGTVAAWCRLATQSVYSDSTVRRILTIAANGSTNVVLLEKTATANTFRGAYIAGSTTDSVSPTYYDNTNYDTDWIHLAMSYSVTADELKVYINGAQSGTTQSSLGTWSGSLSSALCVIGSSSTTAADVWSGWLAHVAVWNVALPAAEMETLYKVADW